MKVGKLIEILSRYNPEADVLMGLQPSWPFEHSVGGVVCRTELVNDVDEFGDDGDVFICEGEQLRYGSKDMWDACTKR